MSNKEIMAGYFRSLKRRKLLSLFLNKIFGYKNIHDDNHLFRLVEEDDRVVIDIYDNISDNRFNRYTFDFKNCYGSIVREYLDHVYITKIYIKRIDNTNEKIAQFAYIFKYTGDDMIKYASVLLDSELLIPLLKIIKKPIL